MRSSELLWYRSRNVWLQWSFFLSSPLPFLARVLGLLPLTFELVRLGFLVLLGGGGCFCEREMTPPCSPEF